MSGVGALEGSEGGPSRQAQPLPALSCIRSKARVWLALCHDIVFLDLAEGQVGVVRPAADAVIPQECEVPGQLQREAPA